MTSTAAYCAEKSNTSQVEVCCEVRSTGVLQQKSSLSFDYQGVGHNVIINQVKMAATDLANLLLLIYWRKNMFHDV